jgi:hypothetical protein
VGCEATEAEQADEYEVATLWDTDSRVRDLQRGHNHQLHVFVRDSFGSGIEGILLYDGSLLLGEVKAVDEYACITENR